MNGAAAGNTGLIATGFNFPDALAAGPFSFQGHPLGLSTKTSIEDSPSTRSRTLALPRS